MMVINQYVDWCNRENVHSKKKKSTNKPTTVKRLKYQAKRKRERRDNTFNVKFYSPFSYYYLVVVNVSQIIIFLYFLKKKWSDNLFISMNLIRIHHIQNSRITE